MPKTLVHLVSDLAGTSVEDVTSWTVDDVQTHAQALLQMLQEHAHSVLVRVNEAVLSSGDSPEQVRLTDALRETEQQLDELRAEQQQLRRDKQELIAQRDAPIDPGRLEEMVQEKIRERDLADTTRRTETATRTAELERRVEEMARSRDALETMRAELEQRNTSLQQAAIGSEAQIAQQRSELEHKSRELAGIVRDASLSVPVRKGNSFEEEFEKILRDRVLEISPYFKGYTLTRTGGGACAHSGDHMLVVKERRMLTEEKAYGTKEHGRDVPVKEVNKFKSDMQNRKAHRGIMVSKYGRISLGDGSPIDGIKIDGNILYIARMVHQDERMVENMLFWWTMMLVSKPAAKVQNDAPVAAMVGIVTQYNLLRTHNRDALKANLKLEKVLIDSMNSHISALAKYTGQRHTRPRDPPGELGKRMRALTDADTGSVVSAATLQPATRRPKLSILPSRGQKLSLGPKRARATPTTEAASQQSRTTPAMRATSQQPRHVINIDDY